MFALPGSFLTTHQALDALVLVFTPDVKCSKHLSLMHFGICMTYNSAVEMTEFGRCPYIAHYNTTYDDRDLYIYTAA